MVSPSLALYKKVHLAWREARRDADSIETIARRLEDREVRLGRKNDLAWRRLTPQDKIQVSKWLPTLEGV